MINLPKIDPMKLSRIGAPFDDPDWIFELKHDGFRSLAYISNGKCELVSRKNNTYKSFERVRVSLLKLKAETQSWTAKLSVWTVRDVVCSTNSYIIAGVQAFTPSICCG